MGEMGCVMRGGAGSNLEAAGGGDILGRNRSWACCCPSTSPDSRDNVGGVGSQAVYYASLHFIICAGRRALDNARGAFDLGSLLQP